MVQGMSTAATMEVGIENAADGGQRGAQAEGEGYQTKKGGNSFIV